jgi:hypothetical protein
VKHLFVRQNREGRVSDPERLSRATATRRNNQWRAQAEPFRLVEVADLNYLHPNFGGVCKDCGAGTLNNRTLPAFVRDEQAHAFRCLVCGSLHVDLSEAS